MTVVLSVFDPERVYVDHKKFDCGHATINKFARDSLKAQVRKSLSVAYVLTDSSENDKLVGFFTIARHAIDVSKLTSLQVGSLPRQIPCSRLAMLGVDMAYKKRNLGMQLMREAFLATKTIAKVAGCYGLYLDADPGAIGLYQKLGLVLLEGDLCPAASPMFIPMASIP